MKWIVFGIITLLTFMYEVLCIKAIKQNISKGKPHEHLVIIFVFVGGLWFVLLMMIFNL